MEDQSSPLDCKILGNFSLLVWEEQKIFNVRKVFSFYNIANKFIRNREFLLQGNMFSWEIPAAETFLQLWLPIRYHSGSSGEGADWQQLSSPMSGNGSTRPQLLGWLAPLRAKVLPQLTAINLLLDKDKKKLFTREKTGKSDSTIRYLKQKFIHLQT